MPNPYPVRITDDQPDNESKDGPLTRISGLIDFTDPSNQPGGNNQNIEQVLTVGNDAGGLTIENLPDPVADQEPATKAYVDGHAGSVSSVFGRTGDVVAQTGDYTASEITGTLGGVLGGTLPNPSMAAGAAATNVGALGGDLTGTLPNPTLAAIISSGTKGDATHSAIVAVDTKGLITSLTETPITGTPPGGSAGGDLTGTYPNPTLVNTGPGAITVGSAILIPIVTIDAQGRVTALSTGAPAIDTIGAGTNITTNDVSTTKHGLAPKLPNDATKYLDGTGAYTVPAGSGSSTEKDYAQVTSNINITGTSFGSPTNLITGNAVTYSGSQTVMVEFFCCALNPGTTWVAPSLYEGSTHIAVIDFLSRGGSGLNAAVTCSMRLTPSAGSHTYSIKAWVDAGTGQMGAGTGGGSGAFAPAYMRIYLV